MVSEANLQAMRDHFESGVTKDLNYRRQQLIQLRKALEENEQLIYKALFSDLKKSVEECWVTENGFVISEINYALKKLNKWTKPQTVRTNLLNWPSKSFILSEPLGVVLIISPWNYPLQLLLTPLVGAIAAGNCVVLKSSEHAPATTALIKKIVAEFFDPRYVLFVEGDGAAVVPALMNKFRFDHVFYTGSTQVGRLIYKMAAEKLVPVTLELGGKSPCVVESDANIRVAAKRIAMTKFSNAGQMCVAPDFILVHESVKAQFIAEVETAVKEFFGNDPITSDHYGKIINEQNFDRLQGLLENANILSGGKIDRNKLAIAPTLIASPNDESKLLTEEIFGPLLPVISFNTMAEALAVVNRNPNPLAFYVFTSSDSKEREWLQAVPSGGGCVNNASWHLTNHSLPFGGRGSSGIGAYHGKFSFQTFSHSKSIMKTPTWFDPSIKYPPFKGKLNLFKKVIR